MKREIKFRGLCDVSNWKYGFLIKRDLDTGRYYIREINPKNEPPRYTDYEVYEYTVCQYTGLKDKNGTEIYEGDIIRIDNCIGVIVWDWVQWAIASGDIGNYHTYDYFIQEIMKDIEVVGNVYENPNYTGVKFPAQ